MSVGHIGSDSGGAGSGVGYLLCRTECPCKEGGAGSCPRGHNSVSVQVEVKEWRRGKVRRGGEGMRRGRVEE
jgi:hypothetical protein